MANMITVISFYSRDVMCDLQKAYCVENMFETIPENP